MCFREQILNSLAGINKPFRNFGRLHCIQHFRLQTVFGSLALTHIFHRFKRKARLYAHGNKVCHNIVARSNCIFRRFAFFNQVLRVVQPYIRTVRITGNPDYLPEVFRLYVLYHLAYETCAKLRYTVSANRTVNLFRRYAERFRIAKNRHCSLVADRNFSRLDMRKFFQ